MASPSAHGGKDVWRAGRSQAVRVFNELVGWLGVEPLPARPAIQLLEKTWLALCEAAEPHHHERLRAARELWATNHGGGNLAEELLVEGGDGMVDASELLEWHRLIYDGREAVVAKKKKRAAFRLKSKAFMLTFNSAGFDSGKALWDSFLVWVRDRAQQAGATQWSAAMERSLHSSKADRVHLHVYFSWLGPSARGVDCRGTDSWVFSGVRPRVDVNSETRGPSKWLKAVQRGHFYCSAHKEGALFTDTNYPAWTGAWVPDAAWVVGLCRQHKLGHAQYIHLSALLRDGHERRKASVEAVRATEAEHAFEKERAWARGQIMAKALPFKPLHPEVERWMKSYEEVEERYRMLVLYGPSRTGKSRLARSLFGAERTLVVDVQHAEHPDLRSFRRHEHQAILLDEVADPVFIVNNKKLLQAHVDGAKLGQSPTQLFSYDVFVWRVPIMLTTNNWCLGELTEDQREWVASNCIAIHVGEPVFEESQAKRPRPCN